MKRKTPHLTEHWQSVLTLFRENRETLKTLYGQLPTSVFQADWGEQNLLIDEDGHFQGMIDYNLAGKDTVLNMALSMGCFGFPHLTGAAPMQPFSEEAQNFRLEKLSDTLRVFKQYYTFSEIEIQTAPLLYKYIIAIEYAAIKDFEKNWMDDRKIHLLFDSIEHMLLRNDIDFKRILC